jgi:hypothetical protein
MVFGFWAHILISSQHMFLLWCPFFIYKSFHIHPKLCNINFHNVTHSLISWNPREEMFVVQTSLLNVTFPSLISWNLTLMQTTKEVNPHPRIVPCVNLWSVTFLFLSLFFFFLCHLLNIGTCIRYIAWEGQTGVDHTSVGDGRTNPNCPHISFVLFHNVTCYTNSIVSRIHVNTTKLCNTTCTLIWLPQVWYYGV